jgi:protein-S-isoprenylcysteine O-methyltransferase Ste14
MAVLAREHRATVSAASILDVTERVVLLLLFLRLAYVNYGPIMGGGHWFNVLIVFSEFLCVGLLLIRRRSDDISTRPADWLLAFFATAAPLLVQPGGGHPLVPAAVGFILLMGGTVIQLSAKLMLRRSFGLVAANRGVKIEGPYRLVRHPMYLGYVCAHIGFLLMAPNVLNLCIYAVGFSAQVFRLLAEERLLMHDPAYVAFARRVRYRLVPGVF